MLRNNKIILYGGHRSTAQLVYKNAVNNYTSAAGTEEVDLARTHRQGMSTAAITELSMARRAEHAK